jgi:hypothetical protein
MYNVASSAGERPHLIAIHSAVAAHGSAAAFLWIYGAFGRPHRRNAGWRDQIPTLCRAHIVMGGRPNRIIGFNWSSSFEITASITSAKLKYFSHYLGIKRLEWVIASSNRGIDLHSFLARIIGANVMFSLKGRRSVNLE